nr:hypothetical protein [Tanacetum cinerariifolium]
VIGPELAVGGAFLAVGQLREFEKLQVFIAGQNDHRLTHEATVEVQAHGQRHLEEVLAEFGRQAR